MSGKKEDLRIRRTHKLLCDAMLDLLDERSYDDISVVDICDKAMVHRATFYKHFKDKNEFMEYVTRVKIREFYDINAKDHVATDLNNAYYAIINNVLNFVEVNRQMLRLSIQSSSSAFLDALHKIIYEEFVELINILQNNGETFKVPNELTAQFLTGGFSAILRCWIADETSYTKQEMALYIEKLLRIGKKSN